MRPADLAMLDPWDAVDDGRGLETELVREVVRGHPLFGKTVRAVARRADQDDVLFVGDAIVAVVHLTWSRGPGGWLVSPCAPRHRVVLEGGGRDDDPFVHRVTAIDGPSLQADLGVLSKDAFRRLGRLRAAIR